VKRECVVLGPRGVMLRCSRHFTRHTLEIKMDNRCRIGAVAGALCRYQIGNIAARRIPEIPKD
jgi:hypothetical protein